MNNEELLTIVRELEPASIEAIAAFLKALQAGQERKEAFQAGNAVIIRNGRPPLSWEEYNRQNNE